MTSPDSQFRVVASAAAFVLCMHAITSTLVARTIDDFSVGPIEVSRTGETLATALQTGLDPNHVLGGGREIEVGQFGGAVQTLLIDTAASELRFSTDSHGYFRVGYGTIAEPLNVDLIADGSDAFLFHTEYLVPNYPAATFPSNAIRVFTATASAATSLNASGATTTELPDRSRLVKVPFTTLGSLDLTAVERIELDLFRVAPGSEFSLKSFQTIPEPATGTLLVLGAAAVAGLLPRHR